MRLPDDIRDEIVDLLLAGGDLPRDYQNLLFPPERREYELVYGNKERRADILAETMAVPLQPVRTFGTQPNEASWHNHLIFGDNLQAMKTLISMKKRGKLQNADGTDGVRLIYIDPPFATRREFSGNQDQKAYQDKVAGAKFIEFIRRRLVLAHELLADNGSLYIQLDTKKVHYLKVILDEIFGEGNFRNEIIWKRQSAHSDAKRYGPIHDTILFYSKSEEFVFNQQYEPLTPEYIEAFFTNVDENGKRYSRGDLTAPGPRPNLEYEWRGYFPPRGRCWAVPREKLDEYYEKGRIHFPVKGIPRLKRYPEDSLGVLLQDIWTNVKIIHNQSPERVNYPTQKPESLTERIIRASSNTGDLVLDAFAGSGTVPAVAEKLGRRWIAIDSGKLAVYTIQKRLLNLKEEIGNRGKPLTPKPFTLYNAGLYDFKSLKSLPWEDWRFFALQLFECQDEPHVINGFRLDGKRRGTSVHVFNHKANPDVRLDEEYIENLHQIVGGKLGGEFCVIAPKAVFDFQQDYIDIEDVRYYALRIPYSFISELHNRSFSTLRQPNDETDVNDIVDSYGFDFIVRPTVKYKVGLAAQVEKLYPEGVIQLTDFESRARIKGEDTRGGMESLSMLMIDFNYNGEVFDFDRVIYGHELAENAWAVRFPEEQIGEKIMAVFVDIYGNEAQEVIARESFVPLVEFAGAESPKGD